MDSIENPYPKPQDAWKDSERSPAPWSITARQGSGYIGQIVDANRKQIASMSPGEGPREYAGEPHDPDAMLIMAAPDLLAVCQRCITNPECDFETLRSIRSQMEAAVNKATICP